MFVLQNIVEVVAIFVEQYCKFGTKTRLQNMFQKLLQIITNHVAARHLINNQFTTQFTTIKICHKECCKKSQIVATQFATHEMCCTTSVTYRCKSNYKYCFTGPMNCDEVCNVLVSFCKFCDTFFESVTKICDI